ncbi:type I-F CRISPR-associated protein Csy2 [Aliidiomarina maris]|uniref:CRISPR-associated Csy2 family protein n=1 Tax=Aliidiomarina maris TaxID=531312 RepID=A0A327X384_9GAMM|nr:type I-F CRISPR-associated protein Csy2 [Aliidiomarina maris]RAK00600.1 CRISPR-associated Csy2 family protein [Aliidiomarina maris]RUO27388.1 type I-F CRISPR-associated protein Csy2 [Aliidiomarina maris]
MIGDVKKLLIIPRIKVHNANALSSPFTIGFPAMTAWLGGVHALQRHLNVQNIPVVFSATAVVSHDVNLQTYKGQNDYVHSIVGTGNPLDKTGSRSAFIEEARCHLEVSLVIEFNGISIDQHDQLLSLVTQLMHAKMKLAGGDIKGFQPPFCINSTEGNTEDLRKIQRHLMPGYVLVERRDLVIAALEEHDGTDVLNAIIDYLAVHHRCEQDEDGNITRHSYRKSFGGRPSGWIVPIATGFHALSDVGEAKNQRDPTTLHRFAESLVTLGEFKMLHRLNSVEQMLWRYHVDGDLYICEQKHSNQPQVAGADLTSIEPEF